MCLWAIGDVDLKGLVSALEDPVYQPFLGRKCCMSSVPPEPQVVSERDILGAFRAYAPVIPINAVPGDKKLYWEGKDCGVDAWTTTVRYDAVKGDRIFAQRLEHEGRLICTSAS